MSHPTLRILTFFPPVVDGEIAAVLLNATGKHPVVLDAPVPVLRALALAVLQATGGIPQAKPPRKPGSGLHHAVRGSKLRQYERVIARVRAGADWKEAALAEGAIASAVARWHRAHAPEGSAIAGQPRGPRIAADSLARYQAVAARVARGAGWREAAAAEGVRMATAYNWWWCRQHRTAGRATA